MPYSLNLDFQSVDLEDAHIVSWGEAEANHATQRLQCSTLLGPRYKSSIKVMHPGDVDARNHILADLMHVLGRLPTHLALLAFPEAKATEPLPVRNVMTPDRE